MNEALLNDLRTYHDLLKERVQLENELKEMPRTLEILETQMLAREKKNHADIRQEYDKIEENLRMLRQSFTEAEMAREKAEHQMDGITNQREYEAVSKEIKEAQQKEDEYRKRIQEQERIFAEVADRLNRVEKSIEDLERQIAEKRAEINEKSAEKLAQIQAIATEEEEIANRIGADIKFRLERIIKHKPGEGIVPLRGAVCMGCHMILPASFVNQVRSTEDISFCPYCSRIIYYEQSEEDTIFEDIVAGALSDLVMEGEESEGVESEEGEDFGNGVSGRKSSKKRRKVTQEKIDFDLIEDDYEN
ncbi:MAG: C4-type zinc ribbon domain-containing protein [Rectinemataceae bacterium]|nr:C4-type zinc ribbon domain-containing protein [Spirochaetaceae bacterium]